MDLKEVIESVENELKDLKTGNLNKDCDELNDKIMKRTVTRGNIFVYGAGRSGFVGKSFVMRLVQLGFRAYMIGESATAPMKKDDLFIVISGSGKTQIVQDILEISSRNKVKIVLISAEKVEHEKVYMNIIIGGKSKTSPDEKILPLGSHFEINALIFLDSLIFKLIKGYNLEEKVEKISRMYREDRIPII
ncbi:MAG: hypothetical protein CIT01_07665 [Methanobacterium sp. BRmetb2]|jgi:6-phospho-3-hexuloisomerase|nr:MAG: hypothetical protein CIT01_07665 [Methanobacterium sp. BRmetb2]